MLRYMCNNKNRGEMMITKITKRKAGSVARVNVELSASLVQRLEKASTELNMDKREIISEALNVWLNARDKEEYVS
jgi:hypothetical protein